MGISIRGPSTVAPLTDLPASKKGGFALSLSLDLSKGAFALGPVLQRAWFLLFVSDASHHGQRAVHLHLTPPPRPPSLQQEP